MKHVTFLKVEYKHARETNYGRNELLDKTNHSKRTGLVLY